MKISRTVINRLTGTGLIIIWILIGGYYGSAGYTEETNTLKLNESMAQAPKPSANGFKGPNGTWYKNPDHWRAEDDLINDREFFKSFHALPNALQPLIALIAFGLLGSCGRHVRDSFLKSTNWSIDKIAMLPLLSIVIGLSIFALMQLLPEFKEEEKAMTYYFFLSFAGGMFTRDFFAWISTRINTFKQQTSGEPPSANG